MKNMILISGCMLTAMCILLMGLLAASFDNAFLGVLTGMGLCEAPRWMKSQREDNR